MNPISGRLSMIECSINGVVLHFYTEQELFSPQQVDEGTITMLSKIAFQPGQKVLDLGCGYGIVGIYAAH